MGKSGIVIAFLLLLSVMIFGIEAAITFYAESKHDPVVKNIGLSGGFRTEVSDEKNLIVLDWRLTNYQIGDYEVDFPLLDIPFLHDLLGEDTRVYYLPNESFYEYRAEKLKARVGNLLINEGTGRLYPLWIASNSGGYPAVKIGWRPTDWFIFDNDLLFIRTGISAWDTSADLQSAKTLYYRKAGFRPFEVWEFGYEEAILFFGRSLDFPYLFSFFPYQSTQEMRNNFVAPWKESFNDNGMLGLYTKLYLDPVLLYAEIFIDDFNITNLKAANNKIAWNAGVEWEILPFLKFYFETAGASKYTYQQHSLSTPPYMYVRYEDQPDLPIEYNMIGYKYGPNSGVANFEIAYTVPNFSGSFSYEFLIFGKRAPFDQWDSAGGTMPVLTSLPWLNDPVLQIENTLSFSFSFNPMDRLKTYGKAGITFVTNEDLEKGKSAIRFSYELGVRYEIPLTSVIDKLW
jgi:hypothetical protein